MSLYFIPSAHGVLALPKNDGPEHVVRAQAALLLRAARARGDKPVRAGPSGLWRLSNGLLQLCL